MATLHVGMKKSVSGENESEERTFPTSQSQGDVVLAAGRNVDLGMMGEKQLCNGEMTFPVRGKGRKEIEN